MTSKTLSDGPWHERYPLHHGARTGDMAAVRLYVEVKTFAADEADGEFLKTPLMFACLHRQFDVVAYLLMRPDVHVSKATSELWTPLMMSVREGDFDTVQLLLEGPQGGHVEINGQNHLGQTALHVGVQFCPLPMRLDVVRLLLAHGANPNQRDGFGKSALQQAASSSQHALASFLLAKTPIPVPPRMLPSRLVAALGQGSKPADTYGDELVPNKWLPSGEAASGDKRPPIATRRDYSHMHQQGYHGGHK